ncbi:methylenetetrahydrofolate reductase C-terminal domain-containing protein [Desulfofustis glycolicus]|uniref:Methylene-tetrahydrofolate reductase C terminal n=1 Tax=Desulfofustis glycolicus DSM 9705 TaxID=1121409 RepID=A0A1M5TKX8_9BACT|nr:methylenetetrahydrofolate reductase C-terminal domain-containing protein [Desulfofustis glycolicus]MCB2216465.1 methylenetetrahydrofolate reductase C-terminal domain-containing protein [Desulfobulbaceae bacterium]SHH51338.1 Methylene-tetrahydrofolate reductase C terminal [Desulfofustis glycolicus DSM 9705]
MIVGQQKPFEEIWQLVKDHKQFTVFGCNTCVAVCHQGGNKEAGILASQLRMRAVQDGLEIKIDDSGIERQCEHEFFEKAEELIQGSEAVLSLACGIGVQFMASKYPKTPVYPALNTTFLGDVPETGLFSEKCQACGDCVLGVTGGVCPVSRCAKRLLNGPCGGSTHGKCEISKDTECAWQLVIDRLEALGRLDDYEKVQPIKDWSKDRAGGPRTFKLEDF